MGLHKRWFCKRSITINENTIEVVLFFKGGLDIKVQINVELLAVAIGVENKVLKGSSGVQLVTLFFKKPDLINSGKLTIKNQRLLLEAIEGMFRDHVSSQDSWPVLSFQNVDYYLGKTEGTAQRAFANKIEKKYA